MDAVWLIMTIGPFTDVSESDYSTSFALDIDESKGHFLYFSIRKRDDNIWLNASAQYGGVSGYHVTTRGRLLALLFALGHEVKV